MILKAQIFDFWDFEIFSILHQNIFFHIFENMKKFFFKKKTPFFWGKCKFHKIFFKNIKITQICGKTILRPIISILTMIWVTKKTLEKRINHFYWGNLLSIIPPKWRSIYRQFWSFLTIFRSFFWVDFSKTAF